MKVETFGDSVNQVSIKIDKETIDIILTNDSYDLFSITITKEHAKAMARFILEAEKEG